jgi:hypothetical protein
MKPTLADPNVTPSRPARVTASGMEPTASWRNTRLASPARGGGEHLATVTSMHQRASSTWSAISGYGNCICVRTNTSSGPSRAGTVCTMLKAVGSARKHRYVSAASSSGGNRGQHANTVWERTRSQAPTTGLLSLRRLRGAHACAHIGLADGHSDRLTTGRCGSARSARA